MPLMLESKSAARAWPEGMGTAWRLSHTRSPSTALEAQVSVEAGFGKTLGLIQT